MNVSDAKLDLESLNRKFERSDPEEVIRWAIKEFQPKIAVTSSFQTESVVLLHMVAKVDSNLPVLFLETGWHFPETIAFKKEVVEKLGLKNVVELKADPKTREAFNAKHGGKPYEKDPDACCALNKVEPLETAMKDLRAWISGIRRSQSKTRKDIRIIEEYQGGMFKINPIANLTSGDIWWYIKEHQLPRHPLFDKGYLSIGCWPCTRPVQPGDDERSGRWAGTEKTECGIHTFLKQKRSKPEPASDNQEEGSEI